MRAALLILVAACATVGPQMRPCKTTCGVRLFGSNDCAGFQEWEDKAVAAFDAHEPHACDRLFGWVVYVQPGAPDGTWLSDRGHTVKGLTWCRQEVIYLGSDTWRASSYGHEVIHALECPFPNAAHDDWYAGWKEDALKKVAQ